MRRLETLDGFTVNVAKIPLRRKHASAQMRRFTSTVTIAYEAY